MANIFETIGGLFTDFTGSWDKFRNGNANEVNQKLNEQNIASQETINRQNIASQEKMNMLNNANAQTMNLASLANQTAINNANIAYQEKANEQNIELTKEQNALNRASQEAMNNASLQNQTNINNANIALQKETNAQNEKLMREQWAREDKTYQRTVEDMQKAGLSPLAMSGLNPTGGAMQMNAPQAAASADFGATKYDRAQINAPEMKAMAQFQRAEMKASVAQAPQARFQAMASGMADIAMDAIGKGVQASQFKDQMQIREMELDTQKMWKAKDQLQAESALSEQIRHNKAMEENGNWQNRIGNAVINKLLGEDANGKTSIQSGVERIKDTATKAQNSEIGQALGNITDSIKATATGNKEMQQKTFKKAYEQGKRLNEAWNKSIINPKNWRKRK